MFLRGKFNPPRKPHWRRHRRNRMKYIRPICRPQRKQARKRIAADYYFNISRQAVSWNKLRYEYVRDKAECIFSFSQKGLIFKYGICTPRLSSIYFQELYKKAFGISCGADIINSRIENARRLLSETAYTIEQIAERCGYNNSIHFSRQFKQVMGAAPSKWRSTHWTIPAYYNIVHLNPFAVL